MDAKIEIAKLEDGFLSRRSEIDRLRGKLADSDTSFLSKLTAEHTEREIAKLTQEKDDIFTRLMALYRELLKVK